MVKHSIVSLPQYLINKDVYLIFAVIQPANISDFKCDIPELRGDNYKVWKERVLLHLGWMDIDYVIRTEEPDPITETSTAEAFCLYDKWDAIDEQFETSDKALASTLIMQFSSTKLTGTRGVRDHIMHMRDIATQLQTLEVTMSDTFLVHYILNTHKDKWSINELLTMCVQ